MIDLSNGSVRKEDALEIRNKMRSEMENGNRFVTLPADKEGLTKEDFTAFRTAFAAHEHAYENTTDRDKHVVKSAAVVERDMNKLLEIEKEGKPKDIERDAKPSRDQQMSR